MLDRLAVGRVVLNVERYPLDRVGEAWQRQRCGQGATIVVMF